MCMSQAIPTNTEIPSTDPVELSEDDLDDLLESAGLLLDSLICGDPMKYVQPDFHETVSRETTKLLVNQTFGLCDENTIGDIVKRALSTFYAHIYPRRSYDSTFIRVNPKVQQVTKHLQALRDIPQPEQRTPEWYAFRHNYLTASSAWKAFVSTATRNQLIYDKCVPYDPDKYKSSASLDSPLQWGVRYEPVSIMWYEHMYGTKIEDFGCIPHPTLSCLAASPDGINTDSRSPRFGRMLEVKNIVNRVINGVPKLEYWVQMQLQMEVCGLNECDFLETRFREYDGFEAYLADGTYQTTADGKPKGVIMYFSDQGNAVYEYSPWNATKDEHERWECEMNQKHAGLPWISNSYWFLDELSCVLVLRNKLWFAAAEPQLKDLWKSVITDRKNGYDHRAPRRKPKVDKLSPVLAPIGCIIDTQTLDGVPRSSPAHGPTLEPSPNNAIISIETECLEDAHSQDA